MMIPSAAAAQKLAAVDARWQSQRPPLEECTWHGLDEMDIEVGMAPVKSPESEGLHWLEKAKHALLLLKLQRPYFLYCLTCAALSAAAFLTTFVDLMAEREPQRRWQDILEGGTWQSACWALVALSLCVEVVSIAVVRRGNCRDLLKDWWSAFDAIVVLLTLLAWGLMRMRRASPMREEAEEADLWLLTLRFALQPCRVLAAAKMAHKVQLMQQSHMDVSFDSLADVSLGPLQACGAADGFPRTSPCSPFEAEATPMPSIFDEER